MTGMARGPRRSAIAAIVATLFNWAPVRAARTFLALALVCLAGIWALEHASGWMFQNQEPKFFGWVPVKWFFDAGEASMLVIFTISGIYDAYRELRR